MKRKMVGTLARPVALAGSRPWPPEAAHIIEIMAFETACSWTERGINECSAREEKGRELIATIRKIRLQIPWPHHQSAEFMHRFLV